MDIFVKDMICKFVINTLVKEKKMSRSEASQLWYNSKTKCELLDSNIPVFQGVSPARCYDELMMELEGNPRWLQGQFE